MTAFNTAAMEEQTAATNLSAAKAVLVEREEALASTPIAERNSDELVPLLSAARNERDTLSNDRRFDNLDERIEKADRQVEEQRKFLEEARTDQSSAKADLASAKSCLLYTSDAADE